MEKIIKGLTSDGIEFDVLPIGTPVQHTKYPEITGKIYSHEFCKGKFSALPYGVDWDNNRLAHDKLGMLNMWPRLESITKMEE